ncbi:MAG TPA: S8 family serine peptidase, partial [Ardenticatenaceae bacterium]|nr:S8 family serine peptidase [Ardenticatenaceae bacterium]
MRAARSYSFVVVAVLVAMLVGSSVGYASPAGQGQAAPIRLKAATFTPGRGEAPPIPPGLAIAGYGQDQRGYYIVQFRGPVEQAWKDAVAATGAEVLDYIPDFAFKVRMNPAEARRVAQVGSVAWVGLFHPAYKLSPTVARDGTHLYKVRVERGVDAGLTTAAIQSSGAQVVRRDGNILVVAANSVQLDGIAHVVDVAWIENFRFYERHNEYGAGGIMGATTANTNGYDGSTQTVAVADTGLGGGTATTAHPDIPSGRITAVYDWPASNAQFCYTAYPNGAQDVDSGHGTHVAASVLSDGGDGGAGKGTAPAARLVFQAVEDYIDTYATCGTSPDGYYLVGIPDDVRQLYQQAYNAGARIHSNSWGSDAAGDYTLDSANSDDFVWKNRDMTITFSAGNAGTDANSDGAVDTDSTGSPASAKNIITVGASENERTDGYPCDTTLSYNACAAQAGKNVLFTYGEGWAADFPANPVKSDPSAGNKEQLAAFSSRGPTDDGRIKPDVVAPGTWILSGYSDLYQEGYDSVANPRNGLFQYDGWGFPLNRAYKYLGGTSMSNPLTAGGAAVVRDYYQEAYTHGASAALVKATLINSAVDLLDENNDGANDNDFPIPNNHEGWGRVDLASATDKSHQFIDQTTGLATNGSAAYTFSVNSSKPVKVSLVWSDYPSTEAATKNLVNDLDLELVAPNGTLYRGNVFSGGWSQAGGSADRTNNVENVYVPPAGTGTWTVTVRGFNVPNGPQPFALVVDGADSALAASTGGGSGTTTTMHVGDLDGTKAKSGNGWK